MQLATMLPAPLAQEVSFDIISDHRQSHYPTFILLVEAIQMYGKLEDNDSV
jgi:hypothetical protein